MGLSLAPLWHDRTQETAGADSASLTLSPEMQKKAGHPLFEEVSEIVAGRCAMCHAAEPLWEGILTAPKNVYLESREDILAQAEAIVMQSALSHAMPPANITYMETSERALIRRWYKDSF